VKLSSEDVATIDFEDARIHLHEPMTRAEFETASRTLLDELSQCTEGLLAKHAEAREIDAVFLTGGSSQIPAVRELYVKRFGEDRVRTADAFTSVAEGLGRASAWLTG
ncbi:Hsp70 family protein, partial [Rhizobium leguminosarum]